MLTRLRRTLSCLLLLQPGQHCQQCFPSHKIFKEEPYDETMEADIIVNSSVAPEPSAPPMSLRDVKPIPVQLPLVPV
jgi:hypothetical protein